jgi:hypothetical protein
MEGRYVQKVRVFSFRILKSEVKKVEICSDRLR